jgi:glucose-1-phosphate cytidylyltransferase
VLFRSGDETIWEREPLEDLVNKEQLAAYKHHDFWKCMDTLRDRVELENLWTSDNAPWKVWA